MVTRTLAGRLAGVSRLPTALQAVLGYYADSGVFDRDAISLKRETDDRLERIVTDVFDPVETALAAEFGRESVDFDYDTKLLLPAQLTLGYVYREARRLSDDEPVGTEIADGLPEVSASTMTGGANLSPEEQVQRAERMTRLAVEALLDGDMRDAINDGEYEDFEVDFPVDADGRERVATVAQSTLEESMREKLAELPGIAADRYEAAVDYSEAHQDRDGHFRELLQAAQQGEDDAIGAIREEYRDVEYDDPPDIFDETERSLPYSRTQYARVGILYDAMLELYRMAGLRIDRSFSKAIVLSIIGAQIWLDDVDDYAEDLAEGQLTPVTAEYQLADTDRAAYENVCRITEQYLDGSKEHATAADSALTGIAVEYIYRSGQPDVLPK